jgi:hypothetical protein
MSDEDNDMRVNAMDDAADEGTEDMPVEDATDEHNTREVGESGHG